MTSKWIISSQVLRAFTIVKVTDAVQRADVGRSHIKMRHKVCSTPCRNTGLNQAWFSNFIIGLSHNIFLNIKQNYVLIPLLIIVLLIISRLQSKYYLN